jgi:hypothetical protein
MVDQALATDLVEQTVAEWQIVGGGDKSETRSVGFLKVDEIHRSVNPAAGVASDVIRIDIDADHSTLLERLRQTRPTSDIED